MTVGDLFFDRLRVTVGTGELQDEMLNQVQHDGKGYALRRAKGVCECSGFIV